MDEFDLPLMQDQATRLPSLISAIAAIIRENAEEITELDQAIGDGDHVINLQRGIDALVSQSAALGQLDWTGALQKIGMSVMSTVGGASGSLYGTFFLTLSKSLHGRTLDLPVFAEVFAQGVDAVKMRGKADLGEKTLLDVLIPVAQTLQQAAAASLPLTLVLEQVQQTAAAGVEATRELVASKGRASFLGDRARGHLDAGAKTSQLMMRAIAEVLAKDGITNG